MPSSRGASPPSDGTPISCIAGRFFTAEPLGGWTSKELVAKGRELQGTSVARTQTLVPVRS